MDITVQKKYNVDSLGASEWCLGTCGLTGIWRLDSSFGINKPEEWLEKAGFLTGYGGKNQGNFLFAIDSEQLKEYKENNNELLTYLLSHPNTKIIHAYKNNAHGPNVVFICIHHMFPEQVEVKPMNNVEEYRNRLVFDDYQYKLKPL